PRSACWCLAGSSPPLLSGFCRPRNLLSLLQFACRTPRRRGRLACALHLTPRLPGGAATVSEDERMWLKWLPWRFLVSRLARSRGFIAPIALLSRLHRFAQPSEVTEPIELLRAGVLFHARGLINTRTIQHNLDWVWPFWVERQFNPRDVAF